MAEHYSQEATRLLADWQASATRPCGPYLLPYEVTNAIFKRVSGGQLTVADAQVLVRGFFAVATTVMPLSAATAERAIDIAQQLNQSSALDSQYLALAERLGCEFWTADRTFRDAAQAAFPIVHWIGERRGIV